MGKQAGASDVQASDCKLWDIPGYLLWFTADSATAVGVALRYLAVSLIGFNLTGSTVAAGWLGSLAAIAQQVTAIFGGTFADRHDRRALIVVNAVVGVVCWGAVAALLMTNRLVFSILLVIAVLESAVNGFLGPASDAMLKSIVDVRSYPKARSLNEGRDATINMAGSPVGGLLYGIAPWLPFLLASVMYLLAGVAAACIRSTGISKNDKAEGHCERTTSCADGDGESMTAARQSDGSRTGASFFRDFVEGWSWSLHRKMLVLTMVSSALVNFGVNGFQYAIQLHLMRVNVNATLIGFVNTGVFLATLTGAFVAGRISAIAPVGPVTCCGFVFICIASLPMLFTDNYWVLIVADAAMCLPFPIINALLLGFVFSKTPDVMQGRITVTLSVPAQALSAFCSATAGSLLPVLGFRGAMLAFWAVMLVSALLIVSSRGLRTVPCADQWDRTPLE
ncbi:MFS transporter [Bifidobacterium sp. 64T4]|uniref:MFS transporter n=1 Tax=Bifidobacterium pongonis TaxID=2834432 RepID=UPI001C56CD9D|nr:MFS transporter [Bifidobacterium pongonis]MBW3094874.1 MFS transporter [Bifidobacterium pongonis]